MDEYDEATCITARELREIGVEIPDGIPDVAWVPRDALTFTPGEARMDGSQICMTIGVQCSASWTWIELKVTV